VTQRLVAKIRIILKCLRRDVSEIKLVEKVSDGREGEVVRVRCLPEKNRYYT
jgi:hypothetical protein